MRLIGSKDNIVFKKLIKKNLPSNLEGMNYIEPFGGSFGVYKNLSKIEFNKVIYNDIHIYEELKLSDNIEVYNEDFSTIIERFDEKNSFFYIDPPYVDKFYYKHNFRIEDHYRLYESIRNIKGKWLLSYHDHPLINELYKDYYFDNFQEGSLYHKKEIVIRNY